ncbi:MAG: Trm112 family protein [Dokdonella sp.]
MDKRLLDILCCPVSKVPLRILAGSGIDALNRAIAAGHVHNGSGNPVSEPYRSALITQDNEVIYPVIDGIPVMLMDESIAVAQLADFPVA